ncbi:hypothetical protein HZU77_013235 [Neisseriaceae bacterium TC5R-5]|nr:hypothetical protein [Neisseriaceae bacterium TC5R-5]
MSEPVQAAARELIARLDPDAPGFFDDLRQLRELVQALSSPAKALVFSLADPGESLARLNAYLDTLQQAPDTAERYYEAMTVLELAAPLGEIGYLRQHAVFQQEGMANRQPSAIQQQAAYQALAAQGLDIALDREAVKAKQAEARALMQAPMENDPDYLAASQALAATREDYKADAERLQALIRAEQDRAHRIELQEQLTQSYRQYQQLVEQQRDTLHHLHRAILQTRAAQTQALFQAEGEAVINAIRAASPISAEQAHAWAEQQQVDSSTLKKLHKLGYVREALYRDMAEFYQLTGGKCSQIRLSSDGGRRANASGVLTHTGEKIINVGTRFDKSVLFHELAHHLENDPLAKAAANGFLLARRESERLYSLRELTGQQYDARERAYKDEFIHPYIGKVYRDQVTEVFSMGVEYLATPKDAALFAANDPTMFALVSGYLTRPLSPAMVAKLALHGEARDGEAAQQAALQTQYQEALASLGASVTIQADHWWQTEMLATRSVIADTLRYQAFTKNKAPTYVGSYRHFRVFEGTFLNQNTRRHSRGHLVVEIRGPHQVDYDAIHGGMAYTKALLALTQHLREEGIRTHLASMAYHYFSTRYGQEQKNQRRVIQLANQPTHSPHEAKP